MRDPYIEAMREDVLTAAVDVMTGAMIALVPSPADCARLAVEGGEPVDQLHLTLVYLGDAVDFDDADRAALIAAGGDMVKGWESVAGVVFAPALFNPTGDEPCAVMLCSGAELAEFYETVMADVTEIVELPTDLHAPWIPHVSVKYADMAKPAYEFVTVEDLSSKCGPIVFDRLRIAFGDEVTDIPFGGAAETPASSDAPPEPGIPAEASAGAPESPPVTASAREVWDGCPRGFHERHTGECPPAL